MSLPTNSLAVNVRAVSSVVMVNGPSATGGCKAAVLAGAAISGAAVMGWLVSTCWATGVVETLDMMSWNDRRTQASRPHANGDSTGAFSGVLRG